MSTDNEKKTTNEQLFSRKKSLLTVQQYANSQGVSAGIVQECAKLGVVQVRKHKDKTYIVDLPLDVGKNLRQQDDAVLEQIDTTAQAQRISELVNKIFQPFRQADSGQFVKPNAVSPPVIPDLHLFSQEEDKAALGNFEPDLGRFDISIGRKIIDAVKITSGRQIVSVAACIALVIFIAAYSWANIRANFQKQQLQQAYASIDKLMNEYQSATRKAKLYELDSQNWQTEAKNNQKAIADLEVQLVQTKEKLSGAQENISQIQKNHVDTLKRLNEQLNEITSQIKQTPGGK